MGTPSAARKCRCNVLKLRIVSTSLPTRQSFQILPLGSSHYLVAARICCLWRRVASCRRSVLFTIASPFGAYQLGCEFTVLPLTVLYPLPSCYSIHVSGFSLLLQLVLKLS